MPTVHLADRTLIRIAGEDARDFLERLITSDVVDMPQATACPSALLTPQGKILFDFLIAADGDGFLIDIRSSLVEDFIRRMTMYRLRARVTFDHLTESQVFAVWGDDAAGGLPDRRFPASAGVARRYSHAAADADITAWDALRISYGIAESGLDFALSDAFPHDVLMDLNKGVDFSKGCFVGQEVVSRMKHRNTARRRVARIFSEQDLPGAGTTVEAAGKPLGTLGTVVGGSALAVVRVDRVADAQAAGATITAGPVAVRAELPDWTGLSFAPAGEAGG